MHDRLNSLLQSLGLNQERPPSQEEWQGFLSHLSLEYLETQLQRTGQDLQKQLDEAMLLNRVIAAVTSSSETNTILTIVCRELAKTLDLSHVTCALLNPEHSEMRVVAEYLQKEEIHSSLGERLPVQDNRLTEFLLKNRGPIVSKNIWGDDLLGAADLVPAGSRHDTSATLLLPLIAKQRVIGIIALNDQKVRQFSKEEINLAQNVAAAASQALENAQLYEELQVKLEEQARVEQLLRNQYAYMEALHETTLGLVNRLDLTNLLENIVERAGTLLGTRHGFLYVFEPETQETTLQAGLGIFKHAAGSRLQPGEGLGGEAWSTQDTVILASPRDMVVQGKNLGRIFAGVSVPLRSEHGLVGVIGLVHLQAGNQFVRNQIDLLERFAQLAALAIDNAMLYAAAQQEIGERERAEKNLELARKMAEAASRAKSTFLARMSHELRTPLTAIIGYSDMMQEEVKELGSPDLVEDVVRIRRSAQILLDVINDVLDLSKVESGEVTMYLQSFDIFDLLQDVASVSQSLVKKKNNRLVLNASPYIGRMTADMTKLRQSLLNLISNAAKFTENGVISIRGSRSREGEQSFIEIEVADTGIGIAPDKQAAIFEPFVQADDSTTRKFGGTGLGLAISRRYCRLMGGDIILESTPNEGSVFTIRLPVDVMSVTRGHVIEVI